MVPSAAGFHVPVPLRLPHAASRADRTVPLCDVVSTTPAPRQPPARTPAASRLASECSPFHPAHITALTQSCSDLPSQRKSSLKRAAGPPDLRPCLPHRGHRGRRPGCRRPSPTNTTLSPVLSPGCAGGVWEGALNTPGSAAGVCGVTAGPLQKRTGRGFRSPARPAAG